MPKRTWNSFVENHPKSKTTAFGVSLAECPKGFVLDKDRKQLPTPYELVKGWLGTALAGDWATMKDGNAVIILVFNDADAALVLKKLPASGGPKKSKIADKSYGTSLRVATFVALAKDAGFAVTLPASH